MTIFTAIGLMSGTSMDGIDVALVKTDGQSMVERGPAIEIPYSVDVRRLIEVGLEAAKEIEYDRTARPGGLAYLETLLTDHHADAVSQFLDRFNIAAQTVDFIGFHGQTVLHRPDVGVTVQLGLGKHLAAATGIDVVYDFRANDMRHGGQGAPLVPVYHRALADGVWSERRTPVAFVNIGGISNITWIAPEGDLFAFDTGPGNALIDQWLQQEAGIPLDQGGLIASEGRYHKSVLEAYLELPYFSLSAPKSLDRLDFEPLKPGVLELSDGARTLARLTAEAIIKGCEHLPEMPERFVICGGGRKNAAIIADLAELADAKGAQVDAAETHGFDGDAMEAEAFAYLAVRSHLGLPLTYPNTTGCREAVSGGVEASVMS
ncbi:MAG: anhydro-N-acetylmuramic acid kinase [Pseudomonadota bacterium]